MDRRTRSLLVLAILVLVLGLSSSLIWGLEPLMVIRHSFQDNREVQQSSWKLELEFNQSVVFDRLAYFVHLEQDGKRVDMNITRPEQADQEGEAGDTVNRIMLSPTKIKKGLVANRIVVESGLPDAPGQHILTGDYVLTFFSADIFTITQIEPSDTDNQIGIHFSDWITMDSLRHKLNIVPEAAIRWYDSYIDRNNVLVLNADFKRGTEYVITIPAEVKSNHNLAYTKTINRFLMPDHRPELSFIQKDTIIERNSRQLLGTETINVEEVLVEALRVPPLAIPLVRALLEQHTSESDQQSSGIQANLASLADLQTELEQQLETWQDKTAEVPEFDLFKGDIFPERQLFFKKQEQNEWASSSFPLTWRKSKESGCLELIRLTNNRGQGQTDFRLFRITDLGLTVKKSERSFLIWVTSLQTGHPMPDVALMAFDLNMTAYYLGRTDTQGLLTVLPQKKFPRVALNDQKPFQNHPLNRENPLTQIIAVSPDDVSYLELKPDNYLQLKDIDHRPATGVAGQLIKGVLITERGVYRPGETVHIKAIVRQQQAGSFSLPEQKKCLLTIQDARDEAYYSGEIELSEFGTLVCDIALNGFDPLGTYTIFLKMVDRDEIVAKRTFQVQEFRPPRHFTEVRFQRGSQARSDYINLEAREEYLDLSIEGKYFAGSPVKHGQVRWKVYYAGTAFDRPDYKKYTFGHPGQMQKELLESGEALLDEKGTTTVRVPLSQYVLAGMYALEVTAAVIDFDGRVASTTELFQEKPLYLVGFEQHDLQVNAEEEQGLTMIVLDSKNKQIKTGSLEVECFQKGWSYTRKRNKYGDYYWESLYTWRRVYSQTIRIVERKATFEFDFAWGGEYLIQASYTRDGQRYTSGTLYNVWGDYYSYEAETGLTAYDPIRISTDQLKYKAGDTMSLAGKSRSRLSHVLITFEREDILHYQVIPWTKKPFEYTIEPTFAPNIYVSMIGTIPRGEFPVYNGAYDSGSPSFAFGTKNIEAQAELDTLEVLINDGQAIPNQLPGSEVSLDFSVRTDQKKIVPTELMVCVVDEAILALTGYTTPDVRTALRFLGPLSVFTFESRVELMKQTPFDLLHNQPLTGGGGSSATSDISTHIRKDFNPVAYYNPCLLTDANGCASVSFILPDTMTRYRVFVIGCDSGVRFGSGRADLTVTRDFYLEPGLPQFLRVGDALTASVSVFNKTPQSGLFTLGFTADRGLSVSAPDKTYPIGAFDRQVITLAAEAEQYGTSELNIRGQFADQSDAVRIKLPIKSPYVIDQDFVLGTFSSPTTLRYTLPEGTDTMPWHSIGDEDLNFKIIFSGSPFLRLNSGLHYLLRYPYGCVEQTSSITMPLAALREVIRAGLIHNITLDQTEQFIQACVDRLFSMQTSSGGFGYWPGDRQPDTWGSLYALTALITTEQSGTELPEPRMTRALDYIKNEVRQSGPNDYTARSWMVYLLARKNQLTRDLFDLAYRDFEKQPREAALFCLMAAWSGKFLPVEEIETKLMNIRKTDPNKSRYDCFYTRYRESAIALLAASTIIPKSDLANEQAQKLMGGIGRDGIWTSTSDTGWSLLALAQHFSGASFGDTNITVTVRHQDREVSTFVLEPKGYQTVQLPAQAFLKRPELELEVQPETTVLYQLEATYPRIDYQQNGYAHGFEISRTIENTDGSKEIHLGDMVKISLKLSIPHYGYRYIVLNDPLPAGLVAINSALKTEESTPLQDTNDSDDWWYYWDPEGYYRFIPNYFEIREDRVLAFRNYNWNGDFIYTYYARAVSAGQFIVPSAKIQLMYDADIVAYTQATTLTILE
ncbi:hypothetical protein JXQ70_16000 [bacterium]|nr:hypothetical protein [bacterium]